MCTRASVCVCSGKVSGGAFLSHSTLRTEGTRPPSLSRPGGATPSWPPCGLDVTPHLSPTPRAPSTPALRSAGTARGLPSGGEASAAGAAPVRRSFPTALPKFKGSGGWGLPTVLGAFLIRRRRRLLLRGGGGSGGWSAWPVSAEGAAGSAGDSTA